MELSIKMSTAIYLGKSKPTPLQKRWLRSSNQMIECEYTIDKMCSDSTESNINMTVPWYLMASYAYYVQDDPIISDRLFDLMAKRMLENWDKIEHFHKSH